MASLKTEMEIHVDRQMRERIKVLSQCCIGSRAAFARLLGDRSSLSDAEVRAIIDRLDQVLTAPDAARDGEAHRP
jgi:hypothetical protein